MLHFSASEMHDVTNAFFSLQEEGPTRTSKHVKQIIEDDEDCCGFSVLSSTGEWAGLHWIHMTKLLARRKKQKKNCQFEAKWVRDCLESSQAISSPTTNACDWQGLAECCRASE